jgi:DnaJ-class molecular chaperone
MTSQPMRSSGFFAKSYKISLTLFLQEVSEAYEVLEDDKKRQLYDNFGHGGVDQNVGGGHEGGFNPFSGFGGFQTSFHSSGGPLDTEDVSY